MCYLLVLKTSNQMILKSYHEKIKVKNNKKGKSLC